MPNAGPPEVVVRRRIEWADTDASGHYHFAVAFRLFEAAEVSLLEAVGLAARVYGRLPRVHVSADYRGVLRFGDLVDVHARVEAVGNTSITYVFEIRRDGEVRADGRTVAVLLDRAEGMPVPWSDDERVLLLGQKGR